MTLNFNLSKLHFYIDLFGNNIPNLPEKSKYAGAIVEPREHPDLEQMIYIINIHRLYLVNWKHIYL